MSGEDVGGYIALSSMILFGVVAITAVVASKGCDAGRHEIRQEAVEQGVAHYDPKTKEFKWDPPTKSEER
jgi:hypothetical protein